MTSILKVDTIQDTAGNNIINESSDTITIGASGDTITIPSGATLSNLGTASGFVGANEAKAWVNFDGTDTVAIRASFNVTSITDNGTGDYTVNFTTAMPDANYAVISSGITSSGQTVALSFGTKTSTIGGAADSKTTTEIRMLNRSGSSNDLTQASVAIFR
jgi:hypothetical protein